MKRYGLLTAALLLGGCLGGGSSSNSTLPTLFADFNTPLDMQKWEQADGFANDNPFNNGWVAAGSYLANGQLVLQLDDQGCPASCSGKPYRSGALMSRDKYGYGRLSARMQAAAGSGVITALFIYNGTPWDEIDIEILGKDTSKVQFNYFKNGVGGHEQLVDLGFDAAQALHEYAIEWHADSIRWNVDGVLKHQVMGSSTTLPAAPGQLMVNLWPAIGVDGWAGAFTYFGPLTARYDDLRYDRY